MLKLIKNNNAVTEVLSFVISFGLTSAVVVSAGFLTTYYVDENTKYAAQTEAENIANRVVNLLVNAYIINDSYPNANYSASIDIPSKLVDHFYYTITVDANGVHVNSYDTRIQVTKDYFNVLYGLYGGVAGSVDGSVGKLTVKLDSDSDVITVEGG